MDMATEIQGIFREVLAIEVPATDTDIVQSGLLDSLGLVSLLFEVEQRFGVTVPLDNLDLDSLRSIDRIVVFVEGLRVA